MKNFLPEGYEEKSTGSENYMKLESGSNKIRVLGSAIVGWELWIANKPVRRKDNDWTFEELSKADINTFTGQKKIPVLFWAFPVWNYQLNRVQILEITQKTIRKGFLALIEDEDWGSPLNYDVVINKIEGDKTEYQVQPKPAKDLDKAVADKFAQTNIRLDALYDGEDPFAERNDALPGAMYPEVIN